MSQTLINAGILVLPAFADDLGAKTVTLKALTALWAETLGMAARDMEADRDLNEFGATALDSVRVAARLRDGFGVTVGPGDLAANPTIGAQVALLTRRAWPPRRRGTLQ